MKFNNLFDRCVTEAITGLTIWPLSLMVDSQPGFQLVCFFVSGGIFILSDKVKFIVEGKNNCLFGK